MSVNAGQIYCVYHKNDSPEVPSDFSNVTRFSIPGSPAFRLAGRRRFFDGGHYLIFLRELYVADSWIFYSGHLIKKNISFDSKTHVQCKSKCYSSASAFRVRLGNVYHSHNYSELYSVFDQHLIANRLFDWIGVTGSTFSNSYKKSPEWFSELLVYTNTDSQFPHLEMNIFHHSCGDMLKFPTASSPERR